jgi:hypothetical protein
LSTTKEEEEEEEEEKRKKFENQFDSFQVNASGGRDDARRRRSGTTIIRTPCQIGPWRNLLVLVSLMLSSQRKCILILVFYPTTEAFTTRYLCTTLVLYCFSV